MKNPMISFLSVLFKAWSIESSSQWTIKNPTKGQCGVTELIVNDYFGGEILKTKVSDRSHYYNLINGITYDYTASQFTNSLEYQDFPSSRLETFTDTNNRQYDYLRNRVHIYINGENQ